MKEFTGFEMVLPVLLSEFKLGTELFSCNAFSRIKLIESLDTMSTRTVEKILEHACEKTNIKKTFQCIL